MDKCDSFDFSDIIENVKDKRLVLASGSPRRCALLKEAGFAFSINPSGAREVIDSALSPEENARLNALRKAKAVSGKVLEALVLGADTIVFYDGRYFGKPKNHADALRTLSHLSGTTHTVLTGIALVDEGKGIELSDCDTTRVTMRNVSPYIIREYVESGKWLSKAGGFAIQEVGDKFIEKIEGSYTNVVGLPMERFKSLFEKYLEIRDEKEP